MESKIVILGQKASYGKNIYTVKVYGEASKSKILAACDKDFGAPFGGEVIFNDNDTYTVKVYTD